MAVKCLPKSTDCSYAAAQTFRSLDLLYSQPRFKHRLLTGQRPGVKHAALQVYGLLLHHRGRLTGNGAVTVVKAQPVAGFMVDGHGAVVAEVIGASGVPGIGAVLPAVIIDYYIRADRAAPLA